MTISKMSDRITVSFYEGIQSDDVVLKALNKTIPPRMRGSKIKEWAYEYLKSNKELWEQIQKEINQDSQSIKSDNESKEDIESSKAIEKDKPLKGMLNIVTTKASK